jgi:hypothetical protein
LPRKSLRRIQYPRISVREEADQIREKSTFERNPVASAGHRDTSNTEPDESRRRIVEKSNQKRRHQACGQCLHKELDFSLEAIVSLQTPMLEKFDSVLDREDFSCEAPNSCARGTRAAICHTSSPS